MVEQQENLRILHEKFKEEVTKQLQNCSNSLEDFEYYQAELKGAAEKQSKFNVILNTGSVVNHFHPMDQF